MGGSTPDDREGEEGGLGGGRSGPSELPCTQCAGHDSLDRRASLRCGRSLDWDRRGEEEGAAGMKSRPKNAEVHGCCSGAGPTATTGGAAGDDPMVDRESGDERDGGRRVRRAVPSVDDNSDDQHGWLRQEEEGGYRSCCTPRDLRDFLTRDSPASHGAGGAGSKDDLWVASPRDLTTTFDSQLARFGEGIRNRSSGSVLTWTRTTRRES